MFTFDESQSTLAHPAKHRQPLPADHMALMGRLKFPGKGGFAFFVDAMLAMLKGLENIPEIMNRLLHVTVDFPSPAPLFPGDDPGRKGHGKRNAHL